VHASEKVINIKAKNSRVARKVGQFDFQFNRVLSFSFLIVFHVKVLELDLPIRCLL
jgi:hypothetical protein